MGTRIIVLFVAALLALIVVACTDPQTDVQTDDPTPAPTATPEAAEDPEPTPDVSPIEDDPDEEVLSEADQMMLWMLTLGEARDSIIRALESEHGVETVDSFTLDVPEDEAIMDVSLEVAVTSIYRGEERVADTGWDVTRGVVSLAWQEALRESYPDIRPGLILHVNDQTWRCEGEFVWRLANRLASRSDWVEECRP